MVFAIWMASSSVENLNTGVTGPNISSRKQRMSMVAPAVVTGRGAAM